MEDSRIKAEACGIEFELDSANLGDMDLLEHVYDLTSLGNDASLNEVMEYVIPLSRTLFGRDQWTRIKGELRKQESEVPHFIRCSQFIIAALGAAANAKTDEELKN